ncbi:MAG: hypothetical protein H6Q13_2456 [Bacteroidetes bacterium]|nr:hypothetical protein [Bacteroidota bacterium]
MTVAGYLEGGQPIRVIALLTYNFLNLSQSVAISNTLGQATNTYTHAADGRKLRTVQQWSSTNSKQTDYVGNVIYESVNGTATTLKRILVDGGYIEGGAYYFYLTDHLGNNRVVANASGGIVQTNHYYPFGMSFAEGVTTSQQPYKYNGKELDTERGLNLYDYSARLMDPALGRFSTVDPLAEKYYGISPYAYCLNDPINSIDPLGLDTINVNSSTPIKEGDVMVDGKGFIATANVDEAKVMPQKSDPDSHYGSDGSYNLYTQNENKAACEFYISIAGGEFIGALFGGLRTLSFLSKVGKAAKASTSVVEEVAVHGNSLKSLKPTWGYKLFTEDGTFLKNGITSKLIPEARYTKAFMQGKYMEVIPFPNRAAAYKWEFMQNTIQRGPLNLNMH